MTPPAERIALPVSGELREYLLVAPAGSDRPAVVIFLHGAGATAAWADEETGWSAHARKLGFVLALPEALPPHRDRPPKFLTNPPRWNDGSDGPTGEPSHADDVGFLAAVIHDVIRRTNADPRRVYVSGFSNGAGMAFRTAADLADRIAAVAPVAGYCRVANPKPSRPVPTFYLIGADDPLVPLRGGDIRSPWRHRYVRREPVTATLERWAAAIGCDPVPRTESRDSVRTDRYSGPVPFDVLIIDGLGHHWPGGQGRLSHRLAGPPSNRIDGTAAVWAFFQSVTE